MVLEKTLESVLDCKEIQPVHPKGNHSWMFIGRTDVETPILWPPDVKSWLIWKDPDAGKDWGQEEKGTTEDEMVGWHHQLNGNEFGRTQHWWWTARPGVLQFMRSQRVRHDWVNWTDWERKYVQVRRNGTSLSYWNELNLIIICFEIFSLSLRTS